MQKTEFWPKSPVNPSFGVTEFWKKENGLPDKEGLCGIFQWLGTLS